MMRPTRRSGGTALAKAAWNRAARRLGVKCIPASFRIASRRRRQLVDDLAVGTRPMDGAESEQRLERGVRVAPAVVAEDVLVQVGRQVLGRGPAMGPVQPGLEVRDRAMRPRQVGLLARDCGALVARPVLVAERAQAAVAAPAVGVDDRTRLGRGLQERAERADGGVVEHGEAQPTAAAALDGDPAERLLAARTAAREPLLVTAEEELVYLDLALERLALGGDRRPAQLVQQHPRRLVVADPELPLKLDRGDPRVVGREQVGGPEPQPQRRPRAVHQRPRRHRCLGAAALALPDTPARVHDPDLTATAAPAAEPLRPATGEQVLAAGLLRGEVLLEVHDRHREVGPGHAVKLRVSPDGTKPVCTKRINVRLSRENAGCRTPQSPAQEVTLRVQRDGRSFTVEVTADGDGLVSHAGSALLAQVADKAGLTRALSSGLRSLRQRRSRHDPARVVRDLCVMLCDGGDCLADLRAVRDQAPLFGEVASDSTAFRVIDAIASDPDGLERLRSAHARAREHAWALGVRPDRVTIDLDATLVTAHSDKDGAAGNFKGGYGFHPLMAYLDETSEALAGELRPGNAGANTARDQIAVAEAALEQIPAEHVETIETLLRVDSAGASHELLDWCRDGRIRFSVGYDLTEAVRAAILELGEDRWVAATDQDGSERQNGQVAELTEGLDLSGSPSSAPTRARSCRFKTT